MTQVAIVGAGPSGLMLAGELARLGVSVRVVDKRSAPYEHSRAFGLQPRTLEILDQRGQVQRFLSRGVKSSVVSLGKEGTLSMNILDIPHPYMLVIPQLDTEEGLHDWVRELGVVIERGVEVTGLQQDESSVTLSTTRPEGESTLETAYVVGCDGGNSVVRRSAGIAFRGKGSQFSAIIADVSLAVSPPEEVFARHSRRGMVALMPFRDGSYRIVVQDNTRMNVPTSTPATFEEVVESARAILGIDLGLHSPSWVSRFRSEQRLADTYRQGRVLLAGDAAHVHSPAGGQGINVGIQDAFHLGWRLAAVVQGRMPLSVLDTYEAELRPVAQRVIRLSDAIFRFNTATSLPYRLLQRTVKEVLLRSRRAQRSMLEDLAGTATVLAQCRGDAPERGRRVVDLPLMVEGRSETLHALVAAGAFVVVTGMESERRIREGLASYVGLDLVVASRTEDGSTSTLVVRPDSCVSMALRRPSVAQLQDEVARWSGEGSRAAVG